MQPRRLSYQIQQLPVHIIPSPSVHSPSVDSILLASHLPRPFGDYAADLGCGSGIISIVLKHLKWRNVISIDIQKEAVSQAAHNLALNGHSHSCYLVVCDLFSAFSSPIFDLIVCNPPSRPSRHPELLPDWNRSGLDGRSFVSRLFIEAKRVLRRNGRILITHSSLVNITRTETELRHLGYQVTKLDSMVIPFREGYFAEYEYLLTLANNNEADITYISGVPMERVDVLEAHLS